MSDRKSMQPCGHPVSVVVSSDEGTAYCGMCAQEPTCGIAGCVGNHHPQDHNAIIERDALRADRGGAIVTKGTADCECDIEDANHG